MRSTFRALVLATAAICASAAFAADRAVVNIPFNFESHGKVYPAGTYAASLDMNMSLLRLRSTTDPKVNVSWATSPADYNPSAQVLRLQFDDLENNTHQLRTIQLGSRITSVLDAPAKHHDAGSLVAAVSGQ
jgi:hypothetical protein